MYSQVKIKSRIRVAPALFSKKVEEAVEDSIRIEFNGHLDSEEGLFIELVDVENIGDGVIIPGDGAVYYDAVFNVISYKPLVQEVVEGVITEIAEFGAFAKIGPIEGLIHKSQIMDDFVSYSKSGTLAGKESTRALKVGDKVRARVIAANLKNLQTAKVGLTMRQEGLGVISWLDKAKEAKPKKEEKAEKPEKVEKKEKEKKEKKGGKE